MLVRSTGEKYFPVKEVTPERGIEFLLVDDETGFVAKEAHLRLCIYLAVSATKPFDNICGPVTIEELRKEHRRAECQR